MSINIVVVSFISTSIISPKCFMFQCNVLGTIFKGCLFSWEKLFLDKTYFCRHHRVFAFHHNIISKSMGHTGKISSIVHRVYGNTSTTSYWGMPLLCPLTLTSLLELALSKSPSLPSDDSNTSLSPCNGQTALRAKIDLRQPPESDKRRPWRDTRRGMRYID